MSFDKHQWPSFDADEAKKAQEAIDDYNAKMKSIPGNKAAEALLSAGDDSKFHVYGVSPEDAEKQDAAERRDRKLILSWLTTCIGLAPQTETESCKITVELLVDSIALQREYFLPK